MRSSPTVSRRESCIGWHCLTASQKFGTVFSIVVFFLFFLILFMFYVGRAKMSYESRNTRKTMVKPANTQAHQQLPSMVQTGTFLRSTTTVQYLPYTSYPDVPISQPMPALSPRAAIWPQHPAIPASNFVPAAYFTALHQPIYTRSPADLMYYPLPGIPNNVQYQNRPAVHPTPTPVSTTHVECASPRWFQKLQKALRIPPGKASTVTSRSPSVASHRQESDAAKTQVERPLSTAIIENHAAKGRAGALTSTNPSGCRDDIDTFSVDTAAATVRSDDFEIPMSGGDIPSATSAGLQEAEAISCDPKNGLPDATILYGADSRSSDVVTTAESLPRVSRESRRRAWETKQKNSDMESSSQSSGPEPRAPRAVYQGGV